MNPAIFRGIFYLSAAVASLFAIFGYADFDPIKCIFTQDEGACVLDIHPFDVKAVAGFLFAGFGNAMAAVAVWRKWGKK